MKENILSLVIAFILASLFYFAFRSNFSNLQTNIQWAQQEVLLWDVIVDVYKDSLQLKSNNELPTIDAMSLMFFRNADEVTPLLTKVDSVGNMDIADQSAWRANIFMSSIWGIDAKEKIYTLPVEWDSTQITMSDIVFYFEDWSSERASVSTR